MRGPEIGETAPNFDLSSTEGVLLMLRDECVHTALVLYLFPAIDDRAQRDLADLARVQKALAYLRTQLFGLSKAPLKQLQSLQRELGLVFPLLHDDRAFLAAYGVNAQAEGPASEPALYMVDSTETVIWKANPIASVEAALPDLLAKAKKLPSASAGYPKKVINRVVDWWVGR